MIGGLSCAAVEGAGDAGSKESPERGGEGGGWENRFVR